MGLCIANIMEPNKILFAFFKIGDCVSIGRDPRRCAIALGLNAPGVSRVHITLEYTTRAGNPMLLARDTSCYGTGYNGGDCIVEKERLVDADTILQIGSSFFEIRSAEIAVIEKPFIVVSQRIEANEMDVSKQSLKRLPMVVEACETKRAKIATAPSEISAELGDHVSLPEWRKQSGNSTSVDDGKNASNLMASLSNISKSTTETRNEGTDDILEYYADDDIKPDKNTLIPAEEEVRTDKFSNYQSGVKGKTRIDSTLRRLITSSVDQSEDGNNCNALLAGAINKGFVEDFDPGLPPEPLFQSTQAVLPSANTEKVFKSEIEDNHCFKAEITASARRAASGNSKSPKVLHTSKEPEPNNRSSTTTCNWEQETKKPKNNLERCSVVGASFISETQKKTYSLNETQVTSDAEIMNQQKLSAVEEGKLQQCADDNETEKGLKILDMSIERIREILKKSVRLENLERKDCTLISSYSICTNSQTTNFKRFKKAPQGSHYDDVQRHSVINPIIGLSDLVDYRKL